MITILRLGHRLPRDERISTHVALVARAFGANELIYAGQHDSSLEGSVERIVQNWGGSFKISYSKKPLSTANEYKKKGYKIIHLTMYGMPLPERLEEMKANGKIMVIVGAEQVPREFYEIADFNISVTSQPHSEVAALAITLDRLMGGKELSRDFSKEFQGKIELVPSEHSKNIKKKE